MTPPRRIVSLISSATEMLYLLGLGDRVLGVSHECDYPPQVAGKPKLTRSLVEPVASSRAIDNQVRSLALNQSALYVVDVDGLEALRPDLIITQAQCDVCAVRYEDVVSAVNNSPVLRGAQILALNPSSLDDVFEDILRVGAAAGVPEVAARAVMKLKERVHAVRAVTSSLAATDIPRVACLEWLDPPMLAANWTPELIEIAGGRPGLTSRGRHSTYAKWSDILDYDPRVVVLMPCGFDLARTIEESQVLGRLDGWRQLAAVREGRVFAVDGNAYFNRSGPRLVDSVEILARLFHPAPLAPRSLEPQDVWRHLETNGEALLPRPS